MAFATAVLAGALRPVAGTNVLFVLAVAWPLIAVAGAAVLGVRPRRVGVIAYVALLLGPVSAVAPGLALAVVPVATRQRRRQQGNGDGNGNGKDKDNGNGNGNGNDDRIRMLDREIPAGAVWAAPVGALLLVFAALRGLPFPCTGRWLRPWRTSSSRHRARAPPRPGRLRSPDSRCRHGGWRWPRW
ncbi:hypothetical protein ACU686_41075 [Yinghuangia aomiensis]